MHRPDMAGHLAAGAAMTEDFPNIRRSTECPVCHEAKAPDLIACWRCFRAVVKHGQAEAILLAWESTLAHGEG